MRTNLVIVAGMALLGLLFAGVSRGQTPSSGSWNVDASGNWSTTSNWTGLTGGAPYANGAGLTATLNNDIGADRTITVDAGVGAGLTIGNMLISDSGSGSSFTIAGVVPITLSSAGDADARVDFTVNLRNTATITAQLQTVAAMNIDKENGGILIFDNVLNSFAAGTTFTVNGGALQANTSFDSLGTTPATPNITLGANGILQAGFDFTEAEWQARVTTTSTGSIALRDNITSANVTNYQGLHLGAMAGQTVTLSSLTVNATDTTYNFGGGGGTLIVATDLANTSGATSLVARSPILAGTNEAGALTTIRLTGTNTFTGTTTVGQHTLLQYEDVAAMGSATGRFITIQEAGVLSAVPAHAFASLQTDLLDKVALASVGTFAISQDESQNLDFSAFGSGNNLRFGALGTATYSGTLTYASGATMRLGGQGDLTISSALQTNLAAIDIDIEIASSNSTSSVIVRFTGDNSAQTAAINVGASASTAGRTATLEIGAQSEVGSGTITIANNSGRVRLLDGVVLSNAIVLSGTGSGSKILGTDPVATPVTAILNGNITTSDINARENDIDVGTGHVLTINGQLGGVGGLEKTGSGLLVLSNSANSIALRFDVSTGLVRFAHDVSASFSSGIFLRGGSIELADGITVAEDITKDDGSTNSTISLQDNVAFTGIVTGAVTLNDNSSGTYEQDFNANDGVLTIQGNITGSGVSGIDIHGDTAHQGTVVFTGGTAYTKRMRLESGFFQISEEADLGNGAGSAMTDQLLFSGGHLDVVADATIDDANRGISIEVDAAIRVAEGVTLTIRNAITTVATAGTDDELLKRGAGTLVLSGANTFVAETQIHHGTLRLDFANSGAVDSNILYNGLTLATTHELHLNGGRFEVVGAAGEANTQAFFDSHFAVGYSEINLAAGSGGSVGVTLGSYVRDQGAVVDFTGLSASATVATTTGTANTILTNTTGQAFATVNGVDWAAKDATNTNIVAGSSIAGFYTANLANDLGGTTTNADISGIDTTVTADETVASMRFNAAETRTITISGGTTELNVGGILVTSNVGDNDITITGTTTTSFLRPVHTNSTDFPIIQNNTQGDLIISAVIANNSGTDAITKAGDGRVILTGTNTYTGVTRIVGGTLSISSNANLGAVGTGAALTLDGGTLQVTGNVSLDNAGANIRNVTLGDKGGTFDVTDANRLVVSGVIDRDGSDTAVNGLTKSGTGTLVLRGVNIYSGATTVTGGVLQVGDNTSTTAITGNNSTRNDLTVQSGGTVSGTGTIAGAGATTVHTFQSGAQLRPGDITSTVGDGEATLTFNGVLSLGAGSITTLTLGTATGNVAPGVGDWVANLATTNPTLLTGAVALGTHDHIEVSHQLRLTSTGTIVIDGGTAGSSYDFSNPTEGDIFNLFDWLSISIDTFNKGARYQDGSEIGQDLDLPTLGGGYLWDTSLFLTHGTLVVVAAVPEPSRMLLLLIGAGALVLRRRRA